MVLQQRVGGNSKRKFHIYILKSLIMVIKNCIFNGSFQWFVLDKRIYFILLHTFEHLYKYFQNYSDFMSAEVYNLIYLLRNCGFFKTNFLQGDLFFKYHPCHIVFAIENITKVFFNMEFFTTFECENRHMPKRYHLSC